MKGKRLLVMLVLMSILIPAVYANSIPGTGASGCCPAVVYAHCEPIQVTGERGAVSEFTQSGYLIWEDHYIGDIVLTGTLFYNPETGKTIIEARVQLLFYNGESSEGTMIAKTTGPSIDGKLTAHGYRHVVANVYEIGVNAFAIDGEWWS